MLVGVISDTHGLLRPEALAALAGSDLIIHAGDVGGPAILDRLGGIAPTFAIRGNQDEGVIWSRSLPLTRVVQADDLHFYVIHNVHDLALDPAAEGYAAVISGHSHRPSVEYRDGVLYLNPGSAGPRRFTLPITIARVSVEGREIRPAIVELQV
jgi:putative phosphoesterase